MPKRAPPLFCVVVKQIKFGTMALPPVNPEFRLSRALRSKQKCSVRASSPRPAVPLAGARTLYKILPFLQTQGLQDAFRLYFRP